MKHVFICTHMPTTTIMTQPKPDSGRSTLIVALIAILFGAMTLKAGGQVLFGGSEYQQAAGNYVLFVVWFNFLAGIAYIIAGIAIWMRLSWAVWLSLIIAVATLIVFAFFGLHILNGGAYETRTMAAMSLRSTVWILISIFSYRKLCDRHPTPI